MFAGNFAPVGWEFCNGQILSIAQNDVLYTLIGTTYGGDGQTTFALPNLTSRAPMHFGTGTDGIPYPIGNSSGSETVTLVAAQMPAHTHPLNASTAAGSTDQPAGNVLAKTAGAGNFLYYEGSVDTAMNAQAITAAGGSLPHDNMQPFLCLNFIIAMAGIFPPQN
jgi:microcystin-dependent protein